MAIHNFCACLLLSHRILQYSCFVSGGGDANILKSEPVPNALSVEEIRYEVDRRSTERAAKYKKMQGLLVALLSRQKTE